MTPTPTLPFDDTTADDLACAVAVLADAADRAQRLASLYRTPIKRAWAERATRAHAAVVRLSSGSRPSATMPALTTQEVGTAP